MIFEEWYMSAPDKYNVQNDWDCRHNRLDAKD